MELLPVLLDINITHEHIEVLEGYLFTGNDFKLFYNSLGNPFKFFSRNATVHRRTIRKVK